MGDLVNYRVLLCVAVAVFVVLMTIYVLHSTRRFPPPLRDHVKPAKKTRRPICSFDVFRDIARGRRDGFVSGNGTWTRNGRGAPEHFEPEICRFRHDVNIPTPEVLQCIRRHRLRYVVFAGDSNSMQYFAAFQGLLTRVGGRCVAIQVDKSHAHAVDAAYYRDKRTDIGPLQVHERDCSGCTNRKIRCDIVPANISIVVEILAFEFTIDAEVTSLMTYRACRAASKWKPCRVTTTSQQFLLKEYLATSPPDLFVLFGNAHDSYRYTLQEYAMNVRQLADMFDVYLRPKTKLIWTSKSAEYILKKPSIFKGAIYENGTMNILQWLTAANRIHFRELRKRFVENGRPLMFLDLYGISAPVLGDWNTDGVHMQPAWYTHIISHLLQSLCPA